MTTPAFRPGHRHSWPSARPARVPSLVACMLSLFAIRSAIGFVPQVPGILSGTLEESIAFGTCRPRIDLAEAARMACLDPVLAAHLRDRQTGEAGCRLSAGERQRLALARLFAGDPRLVVLDEPTAWVHRRTQAVIWRRVRHFARGRTLVAITHSPRVAARFPRVVVLRNGRIVSEALPPAMRLAPERAAEVRPCGAGGTEVRGGAPLSLRLPPGQELT